MKPIRYVIIVVNLLKPESEIYLREMTRFLEARNIEFEIHGYRGEPLHPAIRKEADLAISLGGDGTVLFCARLLAHLDIPIMAVNLGDFGFITEVGKNEWEETFLKFQAGEVGCSRRLMLQLQVIRAGRTAATFLGLNDAVISSQGSSRLIQLRVNLRNTHLGVYRADGVIIATPTGSTAYSAAAGGPLLDPELEAVIINPICPFTLSNRPLVICGDEEICVTVDPGQKAPIILTMDGQNSFALEPEDRIQIARAPSKALIVRSDRRNFFEVIRQKLKWSGGPDA